LLDPLRGLHRAARNAAPVEIARWGGAPEIRRKLDSARDIRPAYERQSAFVAKVENRTIPIISEKLIFRRLYRCNAL
jgi:hypothetical protein